jgi:hypothetical protein
MPKPSYRALDNREKAPKQRGEAGGFTELFEWEEEAPVEWIGGEVRPAGFYSGEAPGSARVGEGRGRSGAEGLGVVPALLYEAECR